MTAFSSRNVSVATLPVEADRVWAVLEDPGLLAELTPLVDRIDPVGASWIWTLVGISALGVSVAPTFTEHMLVTPTSRIVFEHAPPPGATERAGADGVYELIRVGDDRTRLRIDITLWVELPLPSFLRGVVERVMATTMQRTGDGVATNLYRHLDIDPDDVVVQVLAGAGE
jgi:carbon monoxide dehydrogenase subunit G